MSLRRVAVAVVVCLALAAEAPAAPLGCMGRNPTIAAELDTPNTVVLLGHIENAHKTDKGGTTDFVIGGTLRGHPALAGKRAVTMDRYIEIPDPKNPPRFLVLGTVQDGKDIDLHRGYVETPELVRYVEGLLKIDAKDRVKLLRYAFDFLEPRGTDAASDALAVFADADDADVRKAARTFPPEKLRKWLPDSTGNSSRLALYAHLLGHCGKPEDAKTLRTMLDDRTFGSGLDGLLIGYILLDKKAGYDYLTRVIADPEEEFLVKHAGLKALRYFWEYRPEVLTRKQILGGMLALMAHEDIADMPIEQLRQWKVWELTPQVLHLATLESHAALPINRRAILKFALTASRADPKNKAAAEFAAQARKDDPVRVELLEEWLTDEEKVERHRNPEVAPPPKRK